MEEDGFWVVRNKSRQTEAREESSLIGVGRSLFETSSQPPNFLSTSYNIQGWREGQKLLDDFIVKSLAIGKKFCELRRGGQIHPCGCKGRSFATEVFSF